MLNINKNIFFILFGFLFCEAASQITVKGTIYGEDDLPLNNVMVISQHKKTGFICELNGSFKLSMDKTDTIVFACVGLNTAKYCFKDSATKTEYDIKVRMTKQTLVLKEVVIYPIKTNEEIEEQKKNLGTKNTDTYKSYSVLANPITALFERFSKKEQSKRKVEEMMNEDRMRDLLKDLFRIYVSYDIIDLSDEQFDGFISFMSLPEEYIKTASDYELGETVKKKYLEYKALMYKGK
jgi:hypothetical protein